MEVTQLVNRQCRFGVYKSLTSTWQAGWPRRPPAPMFSEKRCVVQQELVILTAGPRSLHDPHCDMDGQQMTPTYMALDRLSALSRGARHLPLFRPPFRLVASPETFAPHSVHSSIRASAMAYPNNVGIKAMEIYVPGQVRAWPTAHPSSIRDRAQQLIQISRHWTKRSLNNTRAFRLANTPLAWVSST